MFFACGKQIKKISLPLVRIAFFLGSNDLDVCRFRWSFYSRQHTQKILINSAGRMAFSGTQTICDICRFWWNLTSQICRFRWNFGNYMYPIFKYFLFKTIFQRFTPGKQRIVSLLKDFGHRYFLPKHFLAPNAGQKMSFLVEFWGN